MVVSVCDIGTEIEVDGSNNNYFGKEFFMGLRRRIRQVASVALAACMLLTSGSFPTYAAELPVEPDPETVTNGTVTIQDTENGSVELVNEDASEDGFPAGTQIQILVTADEGYTLDAFTVTKAESMEDVAYNALGGGQMVFTMPEEDVTVGATFKEQETVLADDLQIIQNEQENITETGQETEESQGTEVPTSEVTDVQKTEGNLTVYLRHSVQNYLTFDGADGQSIKANAGDTVTIIPKNAEKYQVTKLIIADNESGAILQEITDVADLADGYSFTMPDKDVLITGNAVETNGISLLAVGDQGDTLTLQSHAVQNYDGTGWGSGWDTSEYIFRFSDGSTHIGFCAEPGRATPSDGATWSYSSVSGNGLWHMSTTPDPNMTRMAKVLYYGWGGPADSTWLFASTDAQRIILTHAAVARAMYEDWGNQPSADWAHGLNQTGIDAVNNFYNACMAQNVPDGVRLFFADSGSAQTGGSGVGQMLVGIYYAPPRTGYMQLQKVSANAEITNWNPNYSTAGAQYGVYKSDWEAALDLNRIATLTTNELGSSNLIEVDAGTYYVQEKVASPGYELDPQIYTVVVTSGQTATFTSVEQPANDPVGITIQKMDADGNAVAPEGSASLEGAEFTVKYYAIDPASVNKASDLNGQNVTRTWVLQTKWDELAQQFNCGLDDYYKVAGDNFYTGVYGPILPKGVLTIQETKAPAGYTLDNAYTTVSGDGLSEENGVALVKMEGTGGAVVTTSNGLDLGADNIIAVKEQVIRGGVTVEKNDSETNDDTPQGAAKFDGATFQIISLNDNNVVVEGNSYSKGQVVKTFEIEEGETSWTSARDLLPYGNYRVQEVESPEGYLLMGTLQRDFSITTDGQMVNLTGANAIKDDVIRGGFSIEKRDLETSDDTPQGQATFTGATFEVTTLNDNPVLVNGQTYEKGDVVATVQIATGSTYTSANDLLPYGEYKIEEVESPEGYLLEGKLDQTFSIERDGEIVDLTGEHNAFYDQIVRGGVKVQKRDLESGDDTPQGSASLRGFSFDIVSMNENPVLVEGTLYGNGDVVKSVSLSERALGWTSANDLLPYGDYKIVETGTPTGYLLEGETEKEFSITKDGEIVDMSGETQAIKDRVIRGDFALTKKDEASEDMANVLFKITSYTTGESHYFVTDENGYYNSSSQFIPHSQNTNGGTADSGLWFGLDADGNSVPVNDNYGALPYDTYLVEEQPCEANEGKILVSFDMTISRDSFTVDMGTMVDRHIYGGVKVQKRDFDTGSTTPQGDAEDMRATFEIVNANDFDVTVNGEVYGPNEVVYTFRTDDEGFFETSNHLLPYGNYIMREAENGQPVGYTHDGVIERAFSIIEPNKIVGLTDEDHAILNEVIRGGVSIQKRDLETGKAEAQGDATLAGTTFEITNISLHSVVVDGTEYEPGEIVKTIVADETGLAKTETDSLPYGTYTIQEIVEPDGYLQGDGKVQTFTIREDGEMVELTDETQSVYNQVIRGGVMVQKRDNETGKDEAQGDATLAGAAFDIINKSAHSVLVNGTEYAPGAVVTTITTDETGLAQTAADTLPYGTYTVEESGAPEGYLNEGILERTFMIREDGVMVDLTAEDQSIKNDVIRGGVMVQKRDSETGKDTPQGNATLAGATFVIINESEGNVVVDGTEYAPGETVWEMITDANGLAQTDADALPYGTYTIKETAGPNGYLNEGTVERTFVIREDGVIVDMTGEDQSIKNDVIRGGFSVQKRDFDTGSTTPQGDALIQATFEVVNESSHAVVVEGTEYAPGAVVYTFTTDEKGAFTSASDLLPYGKYLVREPAGGQPEGYLNEGVLEREFYVSVDGQIVDLTAEEDSILNKVIRGGVEIQKRDNETGKDEPQGDASLEGAVFEIVNQSRNAVVVGGVEYAPGSVVLTMTTDETGLAQTAAEVLPFGTYLAREIATPDGYLLEGTTEQTFRILIPGQIVELTSYQRAISDDVIRGGVMVQKRDNETGKDEAQGDATLAGADFDIINKSAHSVLVNGTEYAPGAVVTTITTDETGLAQTAADTLPYGTYTVEESGAPEGYLNEGILERTFTIREDGVMVDLTAEDQSIKNDVIRGGVMIQKRDSETGKDTPQGNATLAGATFEIINESEGNVVVGDTEYAPGKVVMTIATDENGVAQTAADALPYGTYTVKETEAPEGYLNEGVLEQTFAIREDGVVVDLTDEDQSIKNDVIRGGFSVQKRDFDTGSTTPQGDALIQATFEIVNESSNAVVVKGSEYAPGEVVYTFTTDEKGTFTSASDLLPYGKYLVREPADGQPEGYRNEGVLEREFFILEDGKIVDLTDVDHSILNEVIRGGVMIQKRDSETGKDEAQGDAVLAGAAFDITNGSTHAVVVGGTEYAPGEVVLTITTDETGLAQTAADALPYGTYKIVETEAPEGYLNEGELERTFTIREDGVMVDLTAAEDSILNDVIRGGVMIQKRDHSSEDTVPQGAATLEGAVFEIRNESIGAVVVDGVEYAPGEVVMTITTDENGVAQTAADALPYGTYKIVETEAPDGYLNAGVLEQTFMIREEGVVVDLTDTELSILNDVVRGDFSFTKTSEQGEAMANTLFKITSETTGESHYFVTDEEGYYSSSADFIPHSQNTNGGTADSGLWFGLDGNGNSVPVDDSVGALPYDTYMVEEQRCDANFGMSLLRFEVVVSENGIEVDMEVVEDTDIHISTKARDDKSGTQNALADADFSMTEEITYENLMAALPHTGIVRFLDRDTGDFVAVNGETVEVPFDFVPEGEAWEQVNGTIRVPVAFDATELAGHTITAVCDIYEDGVLVYTKDDIDDEEEQIHFPSVHTTAVDTSDGDHIITGSGIQSTTDTVDVGGLIVGQSYKLVLVVRDSATRQPLLDADGKVVTAEKIFTADAEVMAVDVEALFNAEGLVGDINCAEYLYVLDGTLTTEVGEEDLVGYHDDYDDVAQSLTIVAPPKVQTGDDGNYPLAMWLLFGGAALCAAGAILIFRRKRKEDVK